jgi:hypothetical protein
MATSEPAHPEDTTVGSSSFPFPLQDSEQILRVCRRHWIYLWPLMVGQVLMAFVPVIVVGALLDQVDALDGTVAQIFTVLAILWVIYWLVKVFLTWYHYHNDVWVITNQRLIDSYRPHPFSQKLSTADLVNLQDMTVERHGILQTTLNYGTVICQTASVDRDFRITGIPEPREVQALVDRERDRERMRVRGL